MNSEQIRTAKELFAGSVGGIVQVISGQPFDTIKVRLQTGSQSSLGDCIKQLIKNEGMKGFYKGTVTPLVGVGACVSVQFAALQGAKRMFVYDNVSHGKPKDLTLTQLFLCGAISGTANSVLSGPIEHIRTRLQVQTSSTGGYNGPMDLVKKVYNTYGIKGIYKGQGITTVREFFGYGMYFGTYEYMMQREMKIKDINRAQISAWNQIVYGAMGGYALWLSIYPVDVVKSKLQTDAFDPKARQYSSAIDCVKKTFKADGLKGFYKGFVPW
ncbi:hypothetical protein HDU92_008272 [Lobulomyces angularis]|nr:hypothetical protein HDU92_008272 [Lobulomyces angularis]